MKDLLPNGYNFHPGATARITQLRDDYEEDVRRLAVSECLGGESTVVTEDHVGVGASRLQGSRSGGLLLLVEVAALVMLGIGINAESGSTNVTSGTGWVFLILGAFLYLVAKAGQWRPVFARRVFYDLRYRFLKRLKRDP